MTTTSKIINETHTRTLAKTVVYRILSVILSMALTAVWGGSASQVAAVGMAALILGSASYYLHDRIWLRFLWNRNEQGRDSTSRSFVKTVAYRIVVLIITFIVAKIIFAGGASGTNQMAATYAIASMAVNAIGYFVIEKLSNYVNWGMKLVD